MYQWQGHRSLTRRVIEAFPEDALFNYSIGGMRPFGDMVRELMGLTANGIEGTLTREWRDIDKLDYHHGDQKATTKAQLLQQWDEVTDRLNAAWKQMDFDKVNDMVTAFNQYQMPVFGNIMYCIDNEIHHRGQAYVYLRSLV